MNSVTESEAEIHKHSKAIHPISKTLSFSPSSHNLPQTLKGIARNGRIPNIGYDEIESADSEYAETG